jgi:hypothetical protein
MECEQSGHLNEEDFFLVDSTGLNILGTLVLLVSYPAMAVFGAWVISSLVARSRPAERGKSGESMQEELRITVGALTDVGQVRDHNEDALGYHQPREREVLAQKGRLYLSGAR